MVLSMVVSPDRGSKVGKEDRCFQKLLRGRSANADRVGSSDHMIGDAGIFSHCSVIDVELFSPSNPHFAASPSRPQPTLIPPFRPYIRFRQPLVPPPLIYVTTMQRALTRASVASPLTAAARVRSTQQLRFAHKVGYDPPNRPMVHG